MVLEEVSDVLESSSGACKKNSLSTFRFCGIWKRSNDFFIKFQGFQSCIQESL